MADETLKKVLEDVLRNIEDKENKWGKHLDTKELASAIFESYGPEIDKPRVEHHLQGCKICKKMIHEERKKNPVYLAWKENVPSNLSEKEFWEEIEIIRKEVRFGQLDNEKLNNPVYKFFREHYEAIQLLEKAID